MNILNFFRPALLLGVCLAGCTSISHSAADKMPVDYVNPYMGNVSHLLVPTFPTIHLPNSLLRVYPERADYTADKINGLPLIVTHHREKSAFNLTPYQGERSALKPVHPYSYDNEHITPYSYSVLLDEAGIGVEFAPSHRSAVYRLRMNPDAPSYLVLNSRDGMLKAVNNVVSGYQQLANDTRVYIYLETRQQPLAVMTLKDGKTDEACMRAEGHDACIVMYYGEKGEVLNVRYGISFISEEQARLNLRDEIAGYDVEAVAARGRERWNETLGRLEVNGGDETAKTVFYTSLYRCHERPVCLSEGGRYFSAFDGRVHEDEGTPFYTDDWIWDTYRAAHPLRLLTDSAMETHIIRSFVRMAEQSDSLWIPTFPEITGDSRRMNSNHTVAVIADACAKGVTGFDVPKAYEACRKAIEEKTLAPWSGQPAGWLDAFYRENGYIPALAPGEVETVPEVNAHEKRQPVAVTLGTAYDEWCLSQVAAYLHREEERQHYLKRSANYRHLFNAETRFFHPKDKNGKFVEPFDYRYSGGMGAREYYGENNGWVYRWDVPHNINDLISLMGGRDRFNEELDATFNEPLGRSKFEFYAQLPDHTGNVGQFSMANEPSLHIPYLYNYSGQPWKTQKRVRSLLRQWFRNDLMGVPGDEDGGGMSAFVVFSMAGLYPVTPGMPVYNIGSPVFPSMKLHLYNGRSFEVEAEGVSEDNKYIQRAMLNGKEWNKPYLLHKDVMQGGKLTLVMGPVPDRQWGTDIECAPPCTEKMLGMRK